MDHVGDIRVVVQPSARGLGVGHSLLDLGLELGRSLGLSKLTVDVMATNAGALELFERHGFHREAVLTRQVRDGDGALQDLVVMACEPASTG